MHIRIDNDISQNKLNVLVYSEKGLIGLRHGKLFVRHLWVSYSYVHLVIVHSLKSKVWRPCGQSGSMTVNIDEGGGGGGGHCGEDATRLGQGHTLTKRPAIQVESHVLLEIPRHSNIFIYYAHKSKRCNHIWKTHSQSGAGVAQCPLPPPRLIRLRVPCCVFSLNILSLTLFLFTYFAVYLRFFSHMNARPPGGGGGGYLHIYAYWVCAARETPIFSPKFPFRSISFSQIFKYSAPQPHHFTVFGRSGDHDFRHFAAHTQPSSASSLRSPALSRPSHSSSLRRGAFFTLPRRSGDSGRPECQPDASYSPFRRPAFTRPSSPSTLQSPAFSRSRSPSSLRRPAFFTLELDPEPPHFSPCRCTYLPKFGVSAPPPRCSHYFHDLYIYL